MAIRENPLAPGTADHHNSAMKKTPLTFVGLVLVGPIALAACSSGVSMESVTTSFHAHFNDRQYVDLGAAGGSLGDEIPSDGDLTDADGNVIGTFDTNGVTTRVTSTSETRFITAQYTFGDGSDSFVIEGAQPFETGGGQAKVNNPLHYAVVGGTGKYMGANGECLVKHLDKDYAVECTFWVIKK
jgi:hypothetical protein